MAFAKHTWTIILLFAFILLLAQCSKAASDDDDDESTSSSPAPSKVKEKHPTISPSPTPPEEVDEEDDDEESPPTSKSTPSVEASTDSDGPPAESPLSISELFELSLPEIGVQKASTAPLTEGAKVANKQLEGIERKITEFKATLTKREANPPTGESKQCLSQCQGHLDDAIDGVKKGIESINKQDLPKANVDISGVATDIETCNDCFLESGEEDKEVNAFNLWIKGVTKECLSNLKQS